jgi:hypothetical protein
VPTVKLLALVAVPPGVVTEIGPLVAPLGTVAVICVEEFTLKLAAAVPLNPTPLAPARFVPRIATIVPDGPFVGVKLVIVGDWDTMKALELDPVPPGVVTEIGPLVAPAGTIAVICVEESTLKLAAPVPLNATNVAPVKLVPVITTLVPAGPLAGEKPEIVGDGITVNELVLVAAPAGVVTEIVPVVAPAGTAAVIWVEESTLKLTAPVPLKATRVAPVRLVPVITTLVPTGPVAGEKFEIAGATAKLFALAAVPPDVVTEMGPVVAPAGTPAVICVEESTLKAAVLVPLNATEVAPVRFVPVMTTLAPTAPLAGANPEIVGDGITVKPPALVTAPMGVVTPSGPIVAPDGTTAVICVAELTVKVVALTPLNRTDVAPVRFVPPMTTFAPAPPLVGTMLPIVGAPMTVKGPGW